LFVGWTRSVRWRNARKSSLRCSAVSAEVLCFRSKNAVTIVGQFPFKHVQIVLRLYQSPAECLLGFDVDSCTLGFDRERVWASWRAIRAIAFRTNLVDMSRRSPSYEFRLAKYAKRGFTVLFPGLEKSWRSQVQDSVFL